MKALYYHGIPIDAEIMKASDPTKPTIMGMGIYASGVLPALLEFGTFDHYYLPEIPFFYRDRALAIPEVASNLHRISFVPEHRQQVLCEPETLVFMNPGNNLRHLANLRYKVKQYDAPITGVLHSLNYTSFADNILLEMLSPTKPIDALFVGSTAGIEVMTKQVEMVQRRFQERYHLKLAFQPKLLHLPLGVNSKLYLRKAVESPDEFRTDFGLSAEPVVILYFGRFSPVSKADLFPLILAFSRLPYVEQNIVLILSGDDTMHHISGRLREFANEHGCGDYVRVFPDPSKEDKIKFYKLADIFVSPSDCIQETFGITIIEAMASSLPVIASDWNGYRDIVVHGKTGFLIPTMLPDYPAEFDLLHSSGNMTSDDLLARTTVVSVPHLTQAMANLCSSRELRRQLGKNGQDRVALFYDWKQVIQAYEASWDDLLQEAKARASEFRLPGEYQNDSYSYKELFGHYPTDQLTIEDWVGLSDMGMLARRTGFLETIAVPEDRFDVEVLQSIIKTLLETSPLPIKHVIDVMPRSKHAACLRPLDDKMIAFVHIARLIKYGLVQTIRPRVGNDV